MERQSRPKPDIQKRTLPCFCCDHPLTQIHHLLPYSIYGHTVATISLCANCHELYHLLFKCVEIHEKHEALGGDDNLEALSYKAKQRDYWVLQFVIRDINPKRIKFLAELVGVARYMQSLVKQDMTVDPVDYDTCVDTLNIMLKQRRKRKTSLEKAQNELEHDRNAVFNYVFEAEKDLQKAITRAMDMQEVLGLVCTIKTTEVDPVSIIQPSEKHPRLQSQKKAISH